MGGGKLPNFEKTGYKFSKAILDGDITPEVLKFYYQLKLCPTDVGLHGGVYQREYRPSSTRALQTCWLLN